MKHYLRLLGYLRPHLPAAAGVVLLTLGSVATQGAAIWIAAEFLQRMLSGVALSPVAAGEGSLLRPLSNLAHAVLEQATPFGTIVAASVALVGARLVIGGLQVLRYVLIGSVSQSILANLRNSLFDRLTRLDLSFSRRTRPGEVATIFLRDVDQLNEAVFDVLDRAVMQPVRLVAVIAIMCSYSWALTLWVAVFLGAGAIAVRVSGTMIDRLCASALQRISELQGGLVEYLSSAMLARLLNREDFERQRFAGINDAIRHSLVRVVFLRNLAPESVSFLFALAAGAVLILGGHQVFVSETLSAATLLKLVMLLALAAASVERLAAMYATTRVSLASARRVFDLLDVPPPPPDPPDAIDAGPFARRLELHGVGFQVDGHPILGPIDLRIEKGQRVVVFGSSGAGKSTLLGLLAGVLRASFGRIEVDGIEFGRLRSHSWRRQLGVVLQDALLLSGTVRDNLLYACPSAGEEDLRRVLSKVGLAGDAPGLSAWLERQVGLRGENLSGGERQRVAIARALLQDPEILLLDEPTSMLDAESKQQVLDALGAASKGRTLVLVTHDPFLRKWADLEVHLEGGCVVGTELRCPERPGRVRNHHAPEEGRSETDAVDREP